MDLLRLVLAAGLVLFLPGCSVLIWFRGKQAYRGDPLALLADGAALSISLLSLLALWFSVVGIRINSTWVIVLSIVCSILLVAGVARKRGAWPASRQVAKKVLVFAPVFGTAIGIIVWRFYQGQGLVLPAWVDSVHHTLIVRKLLEYGGLPPDLSPYIEAPFFYHYGFHLVTALFAVLTRQTPEQSVLWLGQVMNGMVAFSVYRTALAFIKNPVDEDASVMAHWGGIATAFMSAVLVGFAFQMPAYYVTWGRYTLLTGLILLGPAMAAAYEIWEGQGNLSTGIRLALLVAGLCMTHYFVLLLLGLFLLLIGTGGLLSTLRGRLNWRNMMYLVGWTLLGVALALPWIWRVGSATWEEAGFNVVSPIGQTETTWKSSLDYFNYLLYLIGPRHSHILMVLAGVGLVVAMWRSGLRNLALWGGILALLSLPWGLRFSVFRPDHFAIVLFYPASILLASLLVSIIQGLSRWIQPGGLEIPWFEPIVSGLVFVLLIVWGIRQNQNVINPATILVDQEDREALDWIVDNVSVDARFYINSSPWQGTIYRGVDGGYWLGPYTGRFSSLPPVLYTYGSKTYVDQINAWAYRSGKITTCDANFRQLVEEAGLTHIYLHQGRGSLQPGGLANCQGIRQIYEHGKVFIYAIQP